MQNSVEDFPELNSLLKVRRWRRIFSFSLFFIILSLSLNGGNLFIQYTQALQNPNKLQAAILKTKLDSPQIYRPLLASVHKEIKKEVQKMALDTRLEPEAPLPSIFAERKVGVYLHMNNIANSKVFDAEVEKLTKLENAAIVFDVKGSFVYFDSKSALAKKYGLVKPLYDLPQILAELKSAEIYTIARVISLKDDVFANQNLAVRLWNSDKTNFVPEWVDPTNSEVLGYNREIITEIIVAGIDEINLDFVRYPDKFTSEWIGISGEEKIQNVLDFVKMVRQTIDSESPATILSVNTFAILGWDLEENAAALGQDIQKMAPLVDIIAPMLYPSTFSRGNQKYFLDEKSFEYSTVFQTLQKYSELLGEDSVKLRPWIQGYYTTQQQMVDQIEAVYDAGFCGFTIWDIQNDYSESYEILGEIEIPAACRD
jgi:hypothetical protein